MATRLLKPRPADRKEAKASYLERAFIRRVRARTSAAVSEIKSIYRRIVGPEKPGEGAFGALRDDVIERFPETLAYLAGTRSPPAA